MGRVDPSRNLLLLVLHHTLVVDAGYNRVEFVLDWREGRVRENLLKLRGLSLVKRLAFFEGFWRHITWKFTFQFENPALWHVQQPQVNGATALVF